MSNRNQISGSVSLDVSGVAAAVHDTMKPALEHVAEQVRLLASMVAPIILSQQEVAELLTRLGTVGRTEELAANLERLGYRVMAPESAAPVEPVTAEPATSTWLPA